MLSTLSQDVIQIYIYHKEWENCARKMMDRVISCVVEVRTYIMHEDSMKTTKDKCCTLQFQSCFFCLYTSPHLVKNC